MSEAFLRRLSRWQAEQQRAPLAEVHVRARRGADTGDGRDDRESFLHRFEQHVQRPGFDMAVADADGGPVGWAYGFRAAPLDGWLSSAWGSGLSAAQGELPADILELTAAQRTFLLVEFVVLPSHRRRGIATRMSALLLSRLGTDLVVAAVEPPTGDDRPDAAAETLHAWGWEKLGEAARTPAATAAGEESGAREVWVRRPPR
jgi:GNAT superfamily N-acetyltransferase